MLQHIQTIADSKFVQSISAFCVSFLITLYDSTGLEQNSDYWLLLGQMVTIYGGILVGVVRFYHYLKDRKRKAKQPKP